MVRKISFRSEVWFIFWIMVYFMIIGQDYFYSIEHSTGFYWSDVTLFNSYWLLFFPLFMLAKNKSLSFPDNFKVHTSRQNEKSRVICHYIYLGFLALGYSVLHVMLFTTAITLVSQQFFDPVHPFVRTLSTSVTDDGVITVCLYFLGLAILYPIEKNAEADNYSKDIEEMTLSVRQGKRYFKLPVSSILYIASDKPYAAIHTVNGKYLINQSISSLQNRLNEQQFIRIHRSVLVSRRHIKLVKTRNNGDYDLIVKNDDTLRMSRHYRQQWLSILHEYHPG